MSVENKMPEKEKIELQCAGCGAKEEHNVDDIKKAFMGIHCGQCAKITPIAQARRLTQKNFAECSR